MRRDTVMIWGSFISLFAWYHIVFYNFTNSPLRVLAEKSVSADPQMMLTLFNIATGVAVVFAFIVMKDRYLQAHRPAWVAIHVVMVCCAAVMPLVDSLPVLYAAAALCGGLNGVIFYRVFYSSFFYPPKIGWARMLVVTFMVLNVFIHLYALVPEGLHPGLMYGISFLLLCAGVVMSLAYRGNTLEIRKALPENKLVWRDMLPVVLLLVGAEICLTAYKSLVLTIMPETFPIAVHQAIVCAISLAVLFILGDRLKQDAYLKLFLVLLTAALISFQVLGVAGQKVTETFMQPAYFCWDFLLLYYLRAVFYRYGKNQIRLRMVLVIIFMTIVVTEAVMRWVFNAYFIGSLEHFGVLYIVIFGLALLIPQVSRALSPREGEKIESENTLLPVADAEPQPRDTEAALAELTALLPPVEYLTAREEDVLKLLLEWQDTDVIAYMLNISQNTVRTHIKHICEKFGVRSKSELMGMAGLADAMGRFSPREAEVLRLAAAGRTDAEIAAELFISTNTVRSHIHNLCKKCGVSGRTELVRYYNESCAREAGA